MRMTVGSNRGARHGFTLVELLAVIGLMIALSGMLAYAFAAARQEGNIKRCQAEVRMIGEILQAKVNEIALSKLELRYASAPSGAGVVATASPENFEATERSRAIMLCRRDLARLVLPECRADLIYPPASIQFRTRQRTGSLWIPNAVKVAVPSEWNRMRSLIGLRSAAVADNRFQTVTSTSFSPTEDPGIDAIGLYSG